MFDHRQRWRYVEVCARDERIPWFIAAVGGPTLKKGDMPTVQIIELLSNAVFGKHSKGGDCSRGEDDENAEGLQGDEDAEDDPMMLLCSCAPDTRVANTKETHQNIGATLTGAGNRHAQTTSLRRRCCRR